jgi:DNA-binding protein YbaB
MDESFESLRAERLQPSALLGMIADLRKAAGGIGDIQKEMFDVRGTAYSEDRLIKAVVGPRGQLIELDIDPRVYRRPNSKALSAAILTTVRAATTEAMEKVQEIMAKGMPKDMQLGKIGGVNIQELMRTNDANLAERVGQEDTDE